MEYSWQSIFANITNFAHLTYLTDTARFATVSSIMPTEKCEKYECYVCHAEFVSNEILVNHLIVKHDKGPIERRSRRNIKCTYCGDTFFDQVSLKNHVSNKHLGINIHICPFGCPEVYDTREQVFLHTEEKHKLQKKASSKSPQAIWAYPPKNNNKENYNSENILGHENKNKNSNSVLSNMDDNLSASPYKEVPKSLPTTPTVKSFSPEIPNPNEILSPLSAQNSPVPEFRCTKCTFFTKVEKEFNFHLANEHEMCWLCQEKWPFHEKLAHSGVIWHLKNDHQYELFNCCECSFVTLSEASLIAHESNHSVIEIDNSPELFDQNEHEYNCDKCEFTGLLSGHICSAEISVPKSAEKSPTKFKKIDEKPLYVEKSPDLRAFACYSCDSVFQVKFSVKSHILKNHPNVVYDHKKVTSLQFKCPQCPLQFEIYGKLEEHFNAMHEENVLDNRKVFLGDRETTAANIFKRKPTKPVKVEKKIKCDSCNELLHDIRALNRHVKSKHSTKEFFTCTRPSEKDPKSLCKATFPREGMFLSENI